MEGNRSELVKANTQFALSPRPVGWLQSSVFAPLQVARHEDSGNSEQCQIVCLPLTRSCSSLVLPLETCTGTHLPPSLEEEAPSDFPTEVGPSLLSCWLAWPFQVPVHHMHCLCVHVNISLPDFWSSAYLRPVILSDCWALARCLPLAPVLLGPLCQTPSLSV